MHVNKFWRVSIFPQSSGHILSEYIFLKSSFIPLIVLVLNANRIAASCAVYSRLCMYFCSERLLYVTSGILECFVFIWIRYWKAASFTRPLNLLLNFWLFIMAISCSFISRLTCLASSSTSLQKSPSVGSAFCAVNISLISSSESLCKIFMLIWRHSELINTTYLRLSYH